MMLVSVFPDGHLVLLRRHADNTAGTEHRSRYHIPSHEELTAEGVELPSDLWEFGKRGDDSVAGVFIEHARLEHLLARTRMRGDGVSFEIVGRRQAADLLDIDDYWAMNRAFHLADWDRSSRFCGTCAGPMERDMKMWRKFVRRVESASSRRYLPP